MKQFLFTLALIAWATTLPAGEVITQSLTPAVTTVAANSTNTTAGTTYLFDQAQSPVRIYVGFRGYVSTTNGQFKVYFDTASDTNYWDTSALSGVTISVTNSVGASTNVVSDWFESAGMKYIRVGRMENTFSGPVSNIVIKASWPKK